MIETISAARRDLTKHVDRFRKQGVDAEPVVFGDRRKAEAVVVPFVIALRRSETAHAPTWSSRARPTPLPWWSGSTLICSTCAHSSTTSTST